MKVLNLCCVFVVIASIVSCNDDETPSYKKEDFIGKWEMTSTTIPDSDPDDCTTDNQELENSKTRFDSNNYL